MKRFILTIIGISMINLLCLSQYNNAGFIFSGGINYSKYLGKGEGGNYFVPKSPGVQLEATINTGNGIEWIWWGFSYYGSDNYVGEDKVSVKFLIPYYTELLVYQKTKKNPLFFIVGYDYTMMKFPGLSKSDSHHNISFGGGWNLKLSDKIFLQFKLKPYLIIDNSIGQGFGINSLLNLHLDL